MKKFLLLTLFLSTFSFSPAAKAADKYEIKSADCSPLLVKLEDGSVYASDENEKGNCYVQFSTRKNMRPNLEQNVLSAKTITVDGSKEPTVKIRARNRSKLIIKKMEKF